MWKQIFEKKIDFFLENQLKKKYKNKKKNKNLKKFWRKFFFEKEKKIGKKF